jgi:acyl-homoserine lactone acylase PvdQ
MAPDGENFRGINAVRVLSEENKYNIDKVIKAGYDRRLSAFEVLVPVLIKTFESNVTYDDSLFSHFVGPISVLKGWDFRCSENSIATTLAIEWGQKLVPAISRATGTDQVDKTKNFCANAKTTDLLQPLLATINDLQNKFGRWQIPWGEINRLQRISTDIDNKFDDNKPSLPVGFASSEWGMLPSFASRTFAGTKKKYGYHGNIFICAVEFVRKDSFGGKKIKARSLLMGGESGNENSKHFFDQGSMYSKGQFKDVLFYKEDVLKHVERSYHPGE